MQLVLASTSTYRRQLMERLGLPFEVRSPGIDEQARPGEAPLHLVQRLSLMKARAVRPKLGAAGSGRGYPAPAELIIGSDQVALLNGKVMGKPGSIEANIEQLRAAAGRKVRFLTGISLINTATEAERVEVVPYSVRFRNLSEEDIAHYVAHEPALDCAGGFKCEGLGISLFEALSGPDPTALVGLPLIALCKLLRQQGMDPLG